MWVGGFWEHLPSNQYLMEHSLGISISDGVLLVHTNNGQVES